MGMAEAMGPKCSDGKPTSCTCPDGSEKSGSEVGRGMCGFMVPPTSCTCSDGSTVTPPCGGERPSSCTCGDGTTCSGKFCCGRGNRPTQCTCPDGSTFEPPETRQTRWRTWKRETLR